MKQYSCSLAELFANEELPGVQTFTAPSIVEPCFNPSIVDLMLHPELAVVRQGIYDPDGQSEVVEDVSDGWNDDLQNHFNARTSSESNTSVSEQTVDEFGKPARNDESKQSEDKEIEAGTGTEGD